MEVNQLIGWGDEGEPHKIKAIGKNNTIYVQSECDNRLIPLIDELWQPLPEPHTIEQSYFLDFA